MRAVFRSFIIAVLLGFFTVASTGFQRLLQLSDYMILAEDLLAKSDYRGSFRVMKKIIALEKKYDFTLSDEFHFKYARVALAVDSTRIALDSVNKYLSATGKEGEFYNEAQALLREAEKAEETVNGAEATGNEMPADSEDGLDNEIIKTEGTCDGLPEGSSCWMALIDHPECYVWNDDLREGEIMTWSGECSDGFAQGRGTLITTALFEGNTYTNKGEGIGYFQNGKRHGHWVELPLNEIIKQGPYVNGKRHGQWVYRYYGYYYTRYEEKGPYVDGKRHGHWVIHDSLPEMVLEGPYVDGERHGHWVQRYSDGSVGGGPYVDFERHGQWVTRYPDGYKSKRKYVGGRREGVWLNYDYKKKKCWSYTYHKGEKVNEKKVKKEMCQ